ncbi:DUF535 family protein [Rhodobacteraceae bacterium F11138]|nr:DUF535 family protein [Rhodobacteraceae bacterium F11138]
MQQHFSRNLSQCARVCFPGYRPSALLLRTRMIMAGHRHRALAERFFISPPQSALSRIMADRPQMLGALVWPYQCAGWDVPTRLERILDHYRMIDNLPPVFRFETDKKIEILDMSGTHDGLRLIMDQPRWFMREGGLVLNLFKGNFRAYSLAFSLHQAQNGGLEAVIGGLQGRNTGDALAIYRDLTKSFMGIRPRDFLVDVLRILCRQIGVNRILAVSQKHRHHQHPYFNKSDLSPDYDEIWSDRAGQQVSPEFFEIPIDPGHRDLDTVKPKKRSLYRKRRAFLEDTETALCETLPDAPAVTFVDT